MTHNNNFSLSAVFTLALTLLLSFASFIAIAENENIEALVNNNKLTITTEIKTAKQQIVGQPLIVSIEVATDRWFAKGTHIKRFSVANVTILSGSELAINSTKRIKGKTWASQIREITLYPSKAKTYLLPAIDIEISINTELNGIVSGIFTTEPQQFTITQPKALKNIDNFVVSPNFTLEVITDNGRDNDSEPEKAEYAVGDAITQTITLTAKDTPAMMLPEIPALVLSGVSIYQQPSKVFDQSNRGELVGNRVESFTYIFEQEGIYNIPEQTIYWWNTQTNELKQVIIPACTWVVGIKKNNNNNNKQQINVLTNDYQYQQLLTLLFIGLIVFIHLFLLKKHQKKISIWYKNITKYEKRQASQQFIKAIKENNYKVARQHLYVYQELLINKNATNNDESKKQVTNIKTLELEVTEKALSCLLTALNQCAFDLNKSKNESKNEKNTFTQKQAKNLLKLFDKKAKAYKLKQKKIMFTQTIELNK